MNTVAKKFRALLAVLVAGVLGVGLTACSSSGDDLLSSGTDSATDTNASSTEESDAESTEAAEPEEAEERSYEEVIDLYFALSFEPDARGIIEETCHEKVAKEMLDAVEGGDYLESTQSVLEYTVNSVDTAYGAGWELSNEIASAETVEPSSTVETLYKQIGVDISELKEVQVERTISSADGTLTNSDYVTVYVAKIENSWYLEPVSMGMG